MEVYYAYRFNSHQNVRCGRKENRFDTTDPTLEVTALTDADATLTIAQLRRGILTITPTANRTLTLPTPALIVAGLPDAWLGLLLNSPLKILLLLPIRQY